MPTYSFLIPLGAFPDNCVFAGVDNNTIPQPDRFWLDLSTGYSTPTLVLSYATVTLTAAQQSNFTTLISTKPVAANAPWNNQATLMANVTNALAGLRTIQTQAVAFQTQVPYAAANLTNLNDLLTKCQIMAAALNTIATDLIGAVRIISSQFDGLT